MISNTQLLLHAENWRQLIETAKDGETIVWIDGDPYVLHKASPNDVERVKSGVLLD